MRVSIFTQTNSNVIGQRLDPLINGRSLLILVGRLIAVQATGVATIGCQI